MGEVTMPTKKKDLLEEMDVLSAGMERLFYRLFHPTLPLKMLAEPTWQPLTDIYETDGSFVVKMELPGVKADDVEIHLENERLLVRGVRREERATEIKAYHQMEINYGRFERIILLRAAVSRDEISAHFEDGFLKITIPKALPRQRASRIEIVREEG
jgi:HSP20 family protein